jgi:cell division protein FtsB
LILIVVIATAAQIIMQTQKLKEELAQLSAEKRALEDNIDKFRNEMYDKSMEASSEAEKRMHDLERSHMSAAEALENMCAPRLSHSYITSDVGFPFRYEGFRGVIVGIYI